MEFRKFKEIVINNRLHYTDVEETLDEFYDTVNCKGDIPKLMKEIGRKLNVMIIEIPMKYDDFGAVFLNTTYSNYLLLNSNQPRNKMYFAFCHDIYHVLKGSTNYINEKREVYFNNDYTTDENERKANLFAANLLMPKVEFNKIYRLYKSEDLSTEDIVLKLMNYFDSTFVSVLIRLFELDILKDINEVKPLLEIKKDDLKKKLEKLWINTEIITPTLNDEMSHVFNMIEKEGKDLIKNQFMSEYNYYKIVERLKKMYEEIRIIDENI
ncbi:MAG: ImmA/IrrE family metallo-endopeptidase [Anaeromicrobium sp.]|jgi:Zn-dependent peptidase ImmA (M78 family)|uniref:ImmA/IrrE family metallo-endopeptidase n=1 Tax=Anaeromicrobium sp. TaxID=1929132 RepID=UPI002601312A|nr:ImmA/IrrE family metallo-endopeptidase [Anaeromicrobium sp.]MCT4595456.1 ImmA/IrrE family metallo-endopeptidase [Anaeromicrobium sp.]